ncbi:hypothetical protein QBC35DRAFT_383908 [Podospora australis]|uniref:ubiquitinyl hydrolase 1 n=1 Tax=Podospora australis TaxID=1536484 RepID=A0AAN7AHW1_9PEZI|nr:hypothetical protein QBC35DRAFT_383908 [Podospora australis]
MPHSEENGSTPQEPLSKIPCSNELASKESSPREPTPKESTTKGSNPKEPAAVKTRPRKPLPGSAHKGTTQVVFQVIETPETSGSSVRRSGRVRKKPLVFDGEEQREEAQQTRKPLPADKPKKRKAPLEFDLPDNLLEESLQPWKKNERLEWDNWMELESDPDFFNIILRQYGIRGVSFEEILGIDELAIASLPRPVHGFVFLHQFGLPDCSPFVDNKNIWFAKQLSENACATYAILNLLMNTQNLPLGKQLEDFKTESLEMNPPLRGLLISKSGWLREAHNTFARRMDLMEVVHSLSSYAKAWNKKPRNESKLVAPSAEVEPQGGDYQAGDTSMHYSAFVPKDGWVWQLDGLNKLPRQIGKIEPNEDWTTVVQWHLEALVTQLSGDLQYNLFALCGDPAGEALAPMREELATNLRCIQILKEKTFNNEMWDTRLKEFYESEYEKPIDESDISELARYGLNQQLIITLSAGTPGVAEACQAGSDENQPAVDRCMAVLNKYKELIDRQVLLCNEMKLSSRREQDFTPFVHEFILRLADKKHLKDASEETEKSRKRARRSS